MIGQESALLQTKTRRAGVLSGIRDLAWYLFPFTVLFVAWYAVAEGELVPRVWLPTPQAVWEAFIALLVSGQYTEHVGASLTRLLLGYFVSVALGVSLGVVMGLRRGFSEFIEPLITFLNAIAGIVWIPMAILWFGVGDATVTFIVWNSMFFLVLLNTVVGVRSVPQIFVSAMLTMGGNRWQVIRHVIVPGALPNIVTGMRLGMGFGWRALIAAELFATANGLGFMIYNASTYFRTDIIFVGLLTLGIIWLTTDRLLLVRLERWTIRRWGLVSSP